MKEFDISQIIKEFTISEIIAIVMIFGISLSVIGIFIFQYLKQIDRCNNGICKKNNIKWELISKDSNNRIYKAGKEKITINFESIG